MAFPFEKRHLFSSNFLEQDGKIVVFDTTHLNTSTTWYTLIQILAVILMEDRISSTECPWFSPICCISTLIRVWACSAQMIISCYSIQNNIALVTANPLAVCIHRCHPSAHHPDHSSKPAVLENRRFLANGAPSSCPSPTMIFSFSLAKLTITPAILLFNPTSLPPQAPRPQTASF